MQKCVLLLLRVIFTSVSTSTIFKDNLEFHRTITVNFKFVIWRGISNFLLLSSRLMVIMVIGNGFSKGVKTIASYILIIILIFFFRFFKKLMNTHGLKKEILTPIRLGVSKMFVNFEDIDLTNYNLFFLNISLHSVYLSVSIIATISEFIQRNHSTAYIFYLYIFLYVEFCILLSVLIEYFIIKKIFQKSLENYLVILNDSTINYSDYFDIIEYFKEINENSKNKSIILNCRYIF